MSNVHMTAGKWDCESPQSGAGLVAGGFMCTVEPAALAITTACHVKMFMLMDVVQINTNALVGAEHMDVPGGWFVRPVRSRTRDRDCPSDTVVVQSIVRPDSFIKLPRSALKQPEEPMSTLRLQTIEWHVQISNAVHVFIDALVGRHESNPGIDDVIVCVDDEWVKQACLSEAIHYLDNPRYRFDSTLYTVVLDMQSVDEANTFLHTLVSTGDFQDDESPDGWKLLHEMYRIGAIQIRKTSWDDINAQPEAPTLTRAAACGDGWQCGICMEGADVGGAIVSTCAQCNYHAVCLVKYAADKLDGQDSGLHDRMPCMYCRAETIHVKDCETDVSCGSSSARIEKKKKTCAATARLYDKLKKSKGGVVCEPLKRAGRPHVQASKNKKENSAANLVRYIIHKVKTTLDDNNAKFKCLVTDDCQRNYETQEFICCASCICRCLECRAPGAVAWPTFMTRETSYNSMCWLAARLRSINVMNDNFDDMKKNNLIENRDDCDTRMLGPWLIQTEYVDAHEPTPPIRWTLRAMDDVDAHEFTCSSQIMCLVVNMEHNEDDWEEDKDFRVVQARSLFPFPANLR